MELQYKCTIWCSFKFDKDVKASEIIKLLEKGVDVNEIASSKEYCDKVSFDYAFETEEILTPDDNKGYATIELIDYSKKHNGMHIVWDNKPKPLKIKPKKSKPDVEEKKD